MIDDDFIKKHLAKLAEARALIDAKPKPTPVQAPAHTLQNIIDRKSRAFSEMNRLHAQLEWIALDDGRLDAAIQILDLEREIQRCWQIIDRHTATGELMRFEGDEEEEEEPFDPSQYNTLELTNMINAARVWISRAKKARKDYSEKEALIKTIQEYLTH
jgi:hypothetical protein